MVKTKKSQKQRFTSFRNTFCPYCGSGGATLDELTTPKGNVRGYRGACTNEKCKAENFFTSDRAKEWMQEAVS